MTQDTEGQLNQSVQYEVTPNPYHTHNGVDSPLVVTSLSAGTNVTLTQGATTVTSGTATFIQGGITVSAPNVVASLVPGTGISLSATTGTITVTNSGVTSVTAGTAISLSPANGTGAVTITNAGVTSLSAGTNVTLTAAVGAITVSATGSLSFTKRDHTTATVNTVQNQDVVMRSLTNIPAMGANDMMVVGMSFIPGGGTPTIKLKVGSGVLNSLGTPVNNTEFYYRMEIRMMNATNSERVQTFATRSDTATPLAYNSSLNSVDLSSTFTLDFVVNDSNATPITHTSYFFDVWVIKG